LIITRILLYYTFVIGSLDIGSLTIKSRLTNYYSLLDTSRGYNRL
jgi:hypothetical protein